MTNEYLSSKYVYVVVEHIHGIETCVKKVYSTYDKAFETIQTWLKWEKEMGTASGDVWYEIQPIYLDDASTQEEVEPVIFDL